MEKKQSRFITFIKSLKWYNFVFLLIAGVINAVGVTLLMNPANILDGGLSGLSLLLDKVTPPYLILSMFVLVLNLPFFIFGIKKIGAQFMVYSLFAILSYSLFAFIFKDVIKFDFQNNGSPIGGTDLFLCAIFGGLLSGIGSGLTVRFGGALDGVEVMAVIFAKKVGLSVGKFVMIFNIILYSVAAIIYKSWEIPLYSIVAYYVAIQTVDLLVDGLDRAKVLMIITDRCDEICKMLSEEFKRGVTIIDVQGYYSKTEKKMIYCVVNRFEMPKIKRLIKDADPLAFVAISEVAETIGTDVSLKFRKKK